MALKSYLPGNITMKKGWGVPVPPDLTEKDVIEIPNGTVGVDDVFNRTGIYDANGNLCLDTVLARRRDPEPQPCSIHVSGVPYIDETVIYLGTGYMFAHFGHFLTEGIARLWILLYKKYKNIKVVISFDTDQKLPEFVRKMLNALGVSDENIIVLYKNTKFANVIVPTQGARLECYFLPVLNRMFNKIADELGNEKIKTYDKIYLSRSAMNDGRTFGEKGVEKVFEKNGFKIIYPETLPLEHQITLVHHCHEMAGTAGTALHLALFMKSGGRVIQIKRNSMVSDNIDIQKMICDMRKLDLVWVYGSIEIVPTEHYTRMPQIIGITDYIKRFFDDNNFKYKASDLKSDDIEKQRYLNQVKKYKHHMAYAHFMNTFIKLVSLFGITKHGRKIIREYLRRILNARY